MENKKMEIKIADNIPGGQYANALQIRHNQDEFLLNFLNITPPNGRVSGKIMTSPGHFKRFVNAMLDNLKKYEENFGEIKEASSPEKNIGFEDRK
jgi:DNA gyrase inhibitor GyrI